MSKENLSEEGLNGQMPLFDHLDVYRGPANAAISLETKPLQRFSYSQELEYLQHILNLGKESVTAFQSFTAKFQIEVPRKQNLDFCKARKADGCYVVQFSMPEVCDYCDEDLTLDAGISYSCTACGDKQYHFDCDIKGDFYNHWDHDCFPACCKRRHVDLMYITEQDFFDTTPEVTTYIEQEYKSENIESESIVYTVTHSRLSFNDRLEIAQRDYIALQKSSAMAEAKEWQRKLPGTDNIIDFL